MDELNGPQIALLAALELMNSERMTVTLQAYALERKVDDLTHDLEQERRISNTAKGGVARLEAEVVRLNTLCEQWSDQADQEVETADVCREDVEAAEKERDALLVHLQALGLNPAAQDFMERLKWIKGLIDRETRDHGAS